MKPILAALVAAFCLVLTACTTTAELKALDMQREERMAMIKSVDDQNTRAENNRLRLAQEREITLREMEKTKQAQAAANQIRYGAMIKIAEKADAGGRVAIARSLEEKAEATSQTIAAGVPANDPPKPVVLQLPPFQMPKSAVDRWLDAGDRVWDKGIRTVGMILSYKSGVRQIEADVRRTELIEQGNTDRHGATMGTFGKFSDNQTTLGVAGINGVRDVGVETAKSPRIVNNITGDNNKVNAAGRDANQTDETNTNNCPQTQTANGGQSGSGGTGGNGTGTTAGSNGGQGAPSGAGGAPQPQQRGECHAGK